MKQEAKRIKSELKSEEMKEKQEKKEFKDLDLHIDGKKKRSSSKKGNRRKLTNKTLEMLCRKFDNLHASENNLEFKGPKLTLGEVGLLFDIGKSTIHKLYSEWQEDPSFSERINR